MPTAFPYRTPVDHTPHERTNVVVDDEQPSDVLQTVSSDTAQQILATLDGEPATTSDIAEAIDTSIQNARYHLDRLCEADLVEAVDSDDGSVTATCSLPMVGAYIVSWGHQYLVAWVSVSRGFSW